MPAAPPRGLRTVLLVEDDVLVSWSTVQMLEGFGYAVRHAANGKGALRQIEEHAAIALMVVDVGLPDMNGYQLVLRARRRRPGLRALFTTGYDRSAPGCPLPDAITDYLQKPYQPTDLESALRRLLTG